MKIGIIGSGVVGQTLAQGFSAEGHQVMLGTRDTGKQEVRDFAKSNPLIKTGTFAQAADYGEVLVLATKGSVTESAIGLAGTEKFTGKTVIDATNPIDGRPPTNGVLHYFTSLEESLMERLQALLPEAKLVKAFNSVGNAYMYKPAFEMKPTMFICGNDAAAKITVTHILDSFGWETADMGSAASARAIEPLCMLWCIPGMLYNKWSHAFKLMKAGK